jgi:hypothetical protein
MRDCVVVGCGRSGTSLTAGLLARAGYDCGSELLPPDAGGPTGFFEARELNAVNERLLARHEDTFACADGYSRRLRDGERWLAVLPPDVVVQAPPELRDEMARVIPSSPYCCKDPRFGYTLAAWRELVDGAVFVCVFRHPLATAASIAREVRYGDLRVDERTAIEVWKAIYRRLLDQHRGDGEWVFVHYDQLLDGTGVERLARALDVRLDPGLADRRLTRARVTGPPPAETAPLYDELCASAGFSP